MNKVFYFAKVECVVCSYDVDVEVVYFCEEGAEEFFCEDVCSLDEGVDGRKDNKVIVFPGSDEEAFVVFCSYAVVEFYGRVFVSDDDCVCLWGDFLGELMAV